MKLLIFICDDGRKQPTFARCLPLWTYKFIPYRELESLTKVDSGKFGSISTAHWPKLRKLQWRDYLILSKMIKLPKRSEMESEIRNQFNHYYNLHHHYYFMIQVKLLLVSLLSFFHWLDWENIYLKN